MTAREYYSENYDSFENLEDFVVNMMHEFAKLKCEELLEIVAEKVELKFDRDYGVSINKDSILNAVDLDEFIK